MPRSYTLYLVGLPHGWTAPGAHPHCAYQSKLVKGLKMFSQRGHEVISLSNEGGVNPYGEMVQIFTEAERASYFGTWDPQKPYWLEWDPAKDYWREFNRRCVEALKPRVKKGDLVLVLGGNCQVAPIGDHFPGSYYGPQQTIAIVEFGIGYFGVQSRWRVVESYTHREWLAGAMGLKVADYDLEVVPNYFDMDEFPMTGDIGVRGDYFLQIGRVIPDKGVLEAAHVCRDIGAKLVVAGQGWFPELDAYSDVITRVGHADVAQRCELMRNAIATFVLTRYREPFGGVAVESQLMGAPAITTDWGAFTETVDREWRCASHREICEAAERAKALDSWDREELRIRAEAVYSLDAVAPRYERYFDRIWARWGAGYYEMRDMSEVEVTP